MAQFLQGDANEVGIEGAPGKVTGFVNVTFNYDSNLDGKDFFVAARDFVVKSISARPKVAGTDTSGVVTATIKKAADGGAMDSSATALHASTINLKGTINTVQHMVITTSARKVPRGYAIGVDIAGTTTAAAGVITVLLAPA